MGGRFENRPLCLLPRHPVDPDQIDAEVRREAPAIHDTPAIGGPDLRAQHQHLDPDHGPEEGELRWEPGGRMKE